MTEMQLWVRPDLNLSSTTVLSPEIEERTQQLCGGLCSIVGSRVAPVADRPRRTVQPATAHLSAIIAGHCA